MDQMRTLFSLLLLSLTVPVIACGGDTAMRFINMDVPGTHDLGDLGTYVLTATDGELGITTGKDTATDLVWGSNPNVLLGRFGDHGVAVKIAGRGKAKWFFYHNKYKDSIPSANDDLDDYTATGISESSDAEPIHQATTFQHDPETKAPKNNNGHGNNVDGVDSSNPGKGPHHDHDTDPSVDDEEKKGKKKS